MARSPSRHSIRSFKKGPHSVTEFVTEAAGDLDMELRHASDLRQPGRRIILAESLWHDDYWRLWVKRSRSPPFRRNHRRRTNTTSELIYTSQLPILDDRRVPLGFFQQGFESNWNRQQYIKVRLTGNRIKVFIDPDLRDLHGLPAHHPDQESYSFDTGRLSFKDEVEMSLLTMGVGVGPMPPPLSHLGDSMFLSIRADFPAVKIHIDAPDASTGVLGIDKALPSSYLTARFYLWNVGDTTDAPLEARSSPPVDLRYLATFDSNLLDHLDLDIKVPDASDIVRTINLRESSSRRSRMRSTKYNLPTPGIQIAIRNVPRSVADRRL